MSVLSRLFGATAASPITAIGNVLDGLFTSKEEELTQEIILARLAMQPDLAQVELNKIEAAHRSIFVAGWRPFIGWVCGVGLLWAFLGHPIFEWGVALNGSDIPAPVIMTDHLMELVLAMLGLGSLRTVEKLKGRAK
ncbi:MAG: 3TM-type holin [Pseudomonadota bacterium]